MRRQHGLQAETPPLPFESRPSSDTERSHFQKGELFLECAKRNGKTVFTRSRCSYPWYVFQPLYLDHTGCATTFLTNPSGGLAGGDTCSLLATLGKDSHVLFTTPSATKVYRTLEKPAVQSIDLNVGANARCEWMPESTIPFAGSSFEQTVTVRLETGASLILWDALAAGRIVRGERWTFSSYANRIRILLADGRSLEERYRLSPDHDNLCLPFNQAWNYTGSLFIVNDQVPGSTWERIKQDMTTAIENHTGKVLGGISEPSVPGLVVKLLTRSAPDLNTALEQLWRVARLHLWNTPIPSLRRY
ncbi:MAG: urease accessory protein UreD [Nitrospira sp.]|nr:urease accessory protein UreD [Nitrospira sp.]